ncbi:MAG: hypothetical protein CME70_18345 [Halobacteriovorax sp.]|nr:hypothetical protein [Halobacteriovorax sp.]
MYSTTIGPAKKNVASDTRIRKKRTMSFEKLQTFDASTMVDSRISLLAKGPSGSGKTTLALSFPEPIFLIYADVNRDTVRRLAVDGGRDIKGIAVNEWNEYQTQIVPQIISRRIEASTIVVDSISFLAQVMWRDLQGSRSHLTQQDFGTGLRRLSETTRDIMATSIPRGDHPGYHIVFTTHVRDVTSEQGALLKVSPNIMGQFKDQIEAYFDYAVLTNSEMVSSTKKVNEKTVAVRSTQYKIITSPPDRYNTCKGGNLPPEIVISEGGSPFDEMNKTWKLGVSTNVSK